MIVILIIILIIFFIAIYRKNKYLVIKYDITQGIPYKMDFEIEDESIVKFEKFSIKNKNKNKRIKGGKITKKYFFKGLKEGKTTIKFQYIYLDNNRVEHEYNHYIIVDKHKRIKENTNK